MATRVETPYTQRARYYSSRDGFNIQKPKIPAHIFRAERDRAFDPATPTGLIACDLSRELEIGFPATVPLALARYARIRAGERLATRFAASGALYYVIAGSGESAQGGDLIAWDEGDAFCLPGGGETVHLGARIGAAADDFMRLFMMPGVLHCAGGAGADNVDWVTAMVDWVENGNAPASILSTNTSGGVVTRSRPLCPWPQAAIYNGSGDPNRIESFHCGGNVETKETECLALIAKFQKETSNAYDTDARRNPATCNPDSNVPLDKKLGSAVVAPHVDADAVAEHRVDENGNVIEGNQ